MEVLGVPAHHHIEVQLLQRGRNRTRFAGADGAAVQFHDRGQVGGGAAEEHLVGEIEFAAVDTPFHDFNTQFGRGQLHDALPGYAGERVVLRPGGDQLSAGNHENVLARTL